MKRGPDVLLEHIGYLAGGNLYNRLTTRPAADQLQQHIDPPKFLEGGICRGFSYPWFIQVYSQGQVIFIH